MVKIEAIIRPNKLEDVKSALDEIGATGMTVTHVMGCGKQRGRTQYYRGQEYTINLVDKVKLELVVPDDQRDAAIETVQKSAFTGEIGDGKIFFTKIDGAVRIRTSEQGEAALT